MEKEVVDDDAATASGRRMSFSKKKKVIELEYVYDAEMEGKGKLDNAWWAGERMYMMSRVCM